MSPTKCTESTTIIEKGKEYDFYCVTERSWAGPEYHLNTEGYFMLKEVPTKKKFGIIISTKTIVCYRKAFPMGYMGGGIFPWYASDLIDVRSGLDGTCVVLQIRSHTGREWDLYTEIPTDPTANVDIAKIAFDCSRRNRECYWD